MSDNELPLSYAIEIHGAKLAAIQEEHAYAMETLQLQRSSVDPTHKLVDIVFDGPPGPEAGRFVEVEDEFGRSVSLGRWVRRNDGYWVLRVRVVSEQETP